MLEIDLLTNPCSWLNELLYKKWNLYSAILNFHVMKKKWNINS